MSELPPRQRALKEASTEVREYRSSVCNQVLAPDPDFPEGHLSSSAVAWRHEVPEPKLRKLTDIAPDASDARLRTARISTHVRGALRLGASRQRVMKVLEASSTLGIHGTTYDAPILLVE